MGRKKKNAAHLIDGEFSLLLEVVAEPSPHIKVSASEGDVCGTLSHPAALKRLARELNAALAKD